MWILKYDTNDIIYQIVIDMENKLIVTKGEKLGGRDKLGIRD